MSTVYEQGIVLYCDGGCRPIPGHMGFGCHGYRYTTQPAKQGPGLSGHLITRQGYMPTAKRSEEVPLVQPLEYYDFFGGSTDIGTNNIAEIHALYHALNYLKDHTVSVIQVYSDSQYLEKGFNSWINVWQRTGWIKQDGNAVQNVEEWQRLLALKNYYDSKGTVIQVDWVKGHSDLFGNTHAHLLATLGVMHGLQGKTITEFKVSPAQGYWKSEVDRHPFLSYKRLYFTTNNDYNIPGKYYIADPGENDHHFGKRTNDTCFAVLRLKVPDVVIETIRQQQCTLVDHFNTLFSARMDRIYHPDVYPVIRDYGRYSLVRASRNNFNLNYIDDKPLTTEENPIGLCMRAMEHFGLLEEMLNRFVHGEHENLQLHDITDHFYTLTTKGKKTQLALKAEFGVGSKNLQVSLKLSRSEISVPLVLGLDLPNRNQLKYLESRSPKITLVSWLVHANTDTISYQYAIVIESGDDIGIWSNAYANQLFVHCGYSA